MLPERRHEFSRHDVTRLEAFSDAAFAFALTLLVVSLDVPRSYDDLMRTMRGFPSFACCFALLVWIWHEHNMFFRRYGLQDGVDGVRQQHAAVRDALLRLPAEVHVRLDVRADHAAPPTRI